jgi:hypothetical protein
VFAQSIDAFDVPPVVGEETLTLHAGDILEIVPLTKIADPMATWVLTQNGTFVEASREPRYRTRLIHIGRFQLSAEIVSMDGGTSAQRTFNLTVLPFDRAAAAPPTVLTIDPAPDTENRITMPDNRRAFRVSAPWQQGRTTSIDYDAAVDSDADGDTRNDLDNRDTFSFADGIPLIFWVTDDVEREMIIRPTDATGPIDEIHMVVGTDHSVSPTGIVPESLEIVTRIDNGTVTFTPRLDGSASMQVPLLYEWVFGDGHTSRMTQPTHVYERIGTYAVQLTVRNLITGGIVTNRTTTVTITEVSAITQSSSSSSVAAETPSESSGSILGWIWTIIKLLIVVAVLGGITGGAYFVWQKLQTRGSLEDHFARMEEKIAPPITPQDPTTSAPALELKRPMSIQKEEEKEEPAVIDVTPSAPASTPTPTPAIAADAPAPSWLKRGMEKPAPEVSAAPVPPEPKPAPVEAPLPPPPPPPPAPEPIRTPEPPAPPVVPIVDVPSPPPPAPVMEVPVAPPSPPAPALPPEPMVESAPPAQIAPPAPVMEPPMPVVVAPVPAPMPAPVPKPVTPPPTPTPRPPIPPRPRPAPPRPPMPRPAPVNPPMLSPTPTSPTPAAPIGPGPMPVQPTTPNLSAEERERERKRRKRQRYRENLKKREAENPGSTPMSRPAGAPKVELQTAPAPTPAPATPITEATPIVAAPAPAPIPPTTPPVEMNEPIAFIRAEGIPPTPPVDEQH